MKIRRKTRKRGGMVPRRISSRNSSSQPPSGIAPPPPYNGRPPSFNNISSQPSNRRQTVNSSPTSFNAALPSRSSIATSSNLPPAFNGSPEPILPPYKPNSRNMGTGTNKPNRHNMATGTNTPESAVMQTQTNRASVLNMETQTNNNNGRNIPNMTEEQLLQQYTSVYETISSKADAAESAALLKTYLKTIQNPIAIYMVANIDSDNSNFEITKNATIYTYVITRIAAYLFYGSFIAWPTHPSYSHPVDMSMERFRALGYKEYRKSLNKLAAPHVHRFKKPLDTRLIRFFQSISKSPAIGQTSRTIINMPGCQPCTTGGHATDMRVIGALIVAL